MASRSGGGEFFAGLIIGGLVGAAVAVLMAPQSGEETRAQLRDRSLDIKDRAEEGVLTARQQAQGQIATLQDQVAALQQQVSGLQEKGKETLEKGKEQVSKAINRGKDNAAE